VFFHPHNAAITFAMERRLIRKFGDYASRDFWCGRITALASPQAMPVKHWKSQLQVLHEEMADIHSKLRDLGWEHSCIPNRPKDRSTDDEQLLQDIRIDSQDWQKRLTEIRSRAEFLLSLLKRFRAD
jgi:hypothetical protein